MGAITSRDTRRISFVNTFALSPPLTASPLKSLMDENNVMTLDNLTAEKTDDLFFAEPKNLAMEIHDDMETDYWNHRIDVLKKEHRIINKILEDEYEKTIEKTNVLVEETLVANEQNALLNPCFDLRSKVLKCYEENPHQPLMCANIVHDFNESVTACRERAMS